MIVFNSEFIANYRSYTFGFAVYALLEAHDSLSELYERGFLPWTGNVCAGASFAFQLFYLCRSVRVKLAAFALTSENRRVQRKVAQAHGALRVSVVRKAEFEFDADTLQFIVDYAKERFVGGSMSGERVRFVVSRAACTHVLTVRGESGARLAVVLLGVDQCAVHYWFAFFDAGALANLGKAVLLRTIEWARDNDKQFVYLGTCYSNSALYKVRDHKGVQFFDGGVWRDDIAELKARCRAAPLAVFEHEAASDRFKQADTAAQTAMLLRVQESRSRESTGAQT